MSDVSPDMEEQLQALRDGRASLAINVTMEQARYIAWCSMQMASAMPIISSQDREICEIFSKALAEQYPEVTALVDKRISEFFEVDSEELH